MSDEYKLTDEMWCISDHPQAQIEFLRQAAKDIDMHIVVRASVWTDEPLHEKYELFHERVRELEQAAPEQAAGACGEAA